MSKNLKMSTWSEGSVILQRGVVSKVLLGKSAQAVFEMHSSGLLASLRHLNLIADYKLEPKAHDEIHLTQPFLQILAPHEMPFTAIAEIGLKTVSLIETLDKSGFGLIDAHLHNWVFEGPNPVFIDFGSFIKKLKKSELLFHEIEFRREILGPLTLIRNNPHLGELLLYPGRRNEDSNELRITQSKGILELILRIFPSQGIRNLVRQIIYSLSIYPYENTIQEANSNYPKQIVRAYEWLLPSLFWLSRKRLVFVRRKLRNLEEHFRRSQKTYWESYERDNNPQSSERFQRVQELIFELSPSSVLDVGGNSGYLSSLLMKKLPNARFTNLDVDRGSVERGYQRAKMSGDSTSFGIYDLSNPLDDPNLLHHSVRFRSDVVVCLAVSHHILLGDRLPLERMIERLKELTNQYLLLEFMPLGLWSPGQNRPITPDWYGEEAFEIEALKTFKVLSRVQLEENRVIFLLSKRESSEIN